MFPVNSVYGQDLVLALHAGLDGPPPPIWGFMQHAWMPDLPFWEGETLRRWWPVFVFSEHNRRMAESFLGPEGPTVVPIGSPFLYLVELLRSQGQEDDAPSASSTICYPYHYFGEEETVVWHVRLAEHLLDRHGADTTVCLHWHDHENPRIVAAHRDAGLRVITHGYGGDRTFLVRQHAELLRHGTVVANRVSTPIWHAAALGRRVLVDGPIFDVVGEVMKEETPQEVEAADRARWPALYEGVGGAEARRLAGIELGAQHLREPGELRELLGWTASGRAKTAVAVPALKALRYARARRTSSTSSSTS